MNRNVRKLIINADDFGMSYEVNEGIKKGIRAGIITSVSIMVNMPYFEDAVKFLKKNPHIAVGLHFNITEGLPTLPVRETGTMLREDNSFFYWPSMIERFILNKISLSQLNEELRFQYEKLESTGLKISHIDSHHHIHLMPSIFRSLITFAKIKNIIALRSRRFHFNNLSNGVHRWPTFKQLLIIGFFLLNNIRSRNGSQLFGSDSIYDLSWSKKLTEKDLIKIIDNLGSGTTEIICHPAIMSATGNRVFLEPRYNCLQLLLNKSFFSQIKKRNIQLVSKPPAQ